MVQIQAEQSTHLMANKIFPQVSNFLRLLNQTDKVQ